MISCLPPRQPDQDGTCVYEGNGVQPEQYQGIHKVGIYPGGVWRIMVIPILLVSAYAVYFGLWMLAAKGTNSRISTSKGDVWKSALREPRFDQAVAANKNAIRRQKSASSVESRSELRT